MGMDIFLSRDRLYFNSTPQSNFEPDQKKNGSGVCSLATCSERLSVAGLVVLLACPVSLVPMARTSYNPSGILSCFPHRCRCSAGQRTAGCPAGTVGRLGRERRQPMLV